SAITSPKNFPPQTNCKCRDPNRVRIMRHTNRHPRQTTSPGWLRKKREDRPRIVGPQRIEILVSEARRADRPGDESDPSETAQPGELIEPRDRPRHDLQRR